MVDNPGVFSDLRVRLVATPNLNNDLDYSVLSQNSVL